MSIISISKYCEEGSFTKKLIGVPVLTGTSTVAGTRYNVVSGSDSQLQFKNEDTSEYPLVLQEGNKVGIGTTSPARPLHIDTSAHTYVRIESADTAKNSAIEFFERSGVVIVGRDRFCPVKTTKPFWCKC